MDFEAKQIDDAKYCNFGTNLWMLYYCIMIRLVEGMSVIFVKNRNIG